MATSTTAPVLCNLNMPKGADFTGTVSFFAAPPGWLALTAYVAGVIGSQTYLANSTVTYSGVTYTCIQAHTSGLTFNAAYWIADPAALGPPVNVTSPQMDIRNGFSSQDVLLLSPTLSVSSNVVTIIVLGSALATVYALVGYYDIFATRVDTGAEVKLALGQVNFAPNVTAL